MEPEVPLYHWIVCSAIGLAAGILFGYACYKNSSFYAQKKREEEEKNIKESSPGSLEWLIKKK